MVFGGGQNTMGGPSRFDCSDEEVFDSMLDSDGNVVERYSDVEFMNTNELPPTEEDIFGVDSDTPNEYDDEENFVGLDSATSKEEEEHHSVPVLPLLDVPPPLADGPSPLKKRRLRSKITDVMGVYTAPQEPEGASSGSATPLNNQEYTKLYNAAKYKWLKKWIEGKPASYWGKGQRFGDKMGKAREAFRNLNAAEKAEVMKGVIPKQIGSLQPRAEEKEDDEDLKWSMKICCFALEYAFPEEHFNNPEVVRIGSALAAMEAGSPGYQELLQKFKALPSVAADWDKFQGFCDQKTEWAHATELTVALEMSTHSTTPGRYHAHAVFSCLRAPPDKDDRSKRLWFGPRANWKFLGQNPQITNNCTRGRAMRKSVDRGHAYLQIRKTGQLFVDTNWPKGSAFVCESSWVLQWWQLNKITTDAAELEIVDNKHRVEQSLKQLIFHKEQLQKLRYSAEQVELKKKLTAGLKAYKMYPVVNKWKALHGPAHYGKKLRFKFLCLVGDSCLGKTQFGMHLYGALVTYYANCQNATEPNLSKFVRGEHLAILLDEVTPEMVVKNKAMFQCNAEGVNLQESRCQQFALWRFLYSVPLIVCTNSWDLDSMPTDDRKWLNANSEVLRLTEPMWLE